MKLNKFIKYVGLSLGSLLIKVIKSIKWKTDH